jgi:hypothetical protein
MTEIIDGIRIRGEVIVEEINPLTKEVVSREVGENMICINGATALANALVTGTMTAFNYMIISTDNAAVARAHTAIAPVTTASTVITPTLGTSITTWTFTFAAGGSSTIWKFAMATTNGGTSIFNEILFASVKDNNTNDLKITYNASMAP